MYNMLICEEGEVAGNSGMLISAHASSRSGGSNQGMLIA